MLVVVKIVLFLGKYQNKKRKPSNTLSFDECIEISFYFFFYNHTAVEYGRRVGQTPQRKECPNTFSPPPRVSGLDPTQQQLSMPQYPMDMGCSFSRTHLSQ